MPHVPEKLPASSVKVKPPPGATLTQPGAGLVLLINRADSAKKEEGRNTAGRASVTMIEGDASVCAASTTGNVRVTSPPWYSFAVIAAGMGAHGPATVVCRTKVVGE